MSKLGVGALPNIRTFWKQVAILGVLGVGTAYFVKSKVTIRRKKQYIKETSSYDSVQQERMAQIKSAEEQQQANAYARPGFPIKDDNSPVYVRKSEFEGAGSSYMSRKSGDKITTSFWNIFK